MRDLRTALLASALWAIALLLIHVPDLAVPATGAGVGGAVLVVAMRRRGAGLIVLGLLCGAGLAATVSASQPTRELLATQDGHVIEAVVEVTSSATTGRDGRLWFDAQTLEIGPPTQQRRISAPVRVGADSVDGADLGAVLRVTGQGKRADDGERAALIVFGSRAEVTRPASGIFAVAAGARADFIERAAALPEPGAGLLPGLAVGDTRAVSQDVAAAMLASGLSHLTAVSGANCAIVVAAVFWFVSLLGGGRGLRVVLSLLALGAFVVLVTPEPSVVRASAMASLAMLAVLLGRPSAGLPMLSLAVCGLLIVDPWLAATPGFALSAAATAALLVLSRPLLRGLGRWLPRPLALALSVPLAAQIVCGPIVALFSDTQSIVGVIANLLAAPAAPVATVIGLLACLTAPLPALADLLAAAAWLPAAWIQTTATVTAGLPGATAPVPAGPLAALQVAVLSTAITLVLVRPRSRPLHLAAAAVVIIALAVSAARMLLTGPLASMTTPGRWSIAACDIGQGDAVLIRSNGRTALVDTGADPDALARCLAQTGSDRIDLLVLTHFDLDHVGAATSLAGRVTTVLHGPVAELADQRILDELAAEGAVLREGAIGSHGSLGDARWRITWPPPDSAAFPSGNDASLVVDIAGGGVPRMLMLGDLSATPQRQLLSSGRVSGRYDVVKVAHHGSGDQEPALYAEVAAPVALISVGEGNDYGHPRDETLSLLDAAGSRALRTDRRGLVLLGEQDGRLVVWTERQE